MPSESLNGRTTVERVNGRGPGNVLEKGVRTFGEGGVTGGTGTRRSRGGTLLTLVDPGPRRTDRLRFSPKETRDVKVRVVS